MTKKKENPKPRGGARTGSGRKAGVYGVKRSNTVVLLLKVSPETDALIRQQAKEAKAKGIKKTLGQIVDERFKT